MSRHNSSRAAPWVTVTVLAIAACKKDDEIVYDQYNAEDDALSIEVGVEELLPAVSIDLHSSTGEIVVGTADVDPGGGPIGTEHTITVVIADDYENAIDRVTVRTDTSERGEDEYDLDPDSADEGLYQVTLVSVGTEDEVRTDTFTVRLWEAEAAQE